jgi:hypothetical protein
VRRVGRGPDVDDVEERIGRRLDPHHACVVIEVLAQVRKLVRRHVVEQIALRLVDLRRHPVHAAVHVGDQHDALAGIDEVHERRRRAETGRERDAVVGAFERRDRFLQCGPRRIRNARIVVALVLPDRLLDIRRRLVDRGRDRTGGGIRLLSVVDCAGLELHGVDSRAGRDSRRRREDDRLRCAMQRLSFWSSSV